MRKLFFTLGLAMTITFLSAQDSRLWIGAHVTPTLSFLRGNASIKKYHETGVFYATGLDLLYRLNSHWSFRSGIEFEKKGSTSNIELTDADGMPWGEGYFKSTWDYLGIPLMLSYRLVDRKIDLVGSLGPNFGFLLRARSESPTFDNLSTHSEEVTQEFNLLDIGIAAAVGLEIPLLETLMGTISIRDYYGVHTIAKTNSLGSTNIKTQTLGLQVGMTMNL